MCWWVSTTAEFLYNVKKIAYVVHDVKTVWHRLYKSNNFEGQVWPPLFLLTLLDKFSCNFLK